MLCFFVFVVAYSPANAQRASSRSLCPKIPCPRALQLEFVPLNGTPLTQSVPISTMLLSILESTLTRRRASVDSKRFTNNLNSLESTLTKNRGEGAVIVN